MNFFDRFNLDGCSCGKEHSFSSKIIICDGEASRKTAEILKEKGFKKVFMLTDINTYAAAGEKVKNYLEKEGVKVLSYTLQSEMPEQDETYTGLAVMNFTPDCDAIISVGSGVINDIGKILSNVSGKFYVIIGTAPSMDGYASATSSVEMAGLKISLPSRCADVIIGDTEILKNAPYKMMVSGLGDMLAKYVSICEWRISALINGEYYCEKIAALVRDALKICVDNAEGLLKKDKAAVKAVFEGLVICGAAMNFAGVSRPASGIEHYFSHIWDMRALEYGTNSEFHGLQCALGTLINIRLYEQLKNITPNREKALRYVSEFDVNEWNNQLEKFLGRSAKSMIELEKKEQKYNKEVHKERIEKIIENWDGILKIIDEELPSSEFIFGLLKKIGAPLTPEDIGLDSGILPMTFKASKDMRDKYVLSRLCWDLGIIEEIKF